MTEVNTTPEKVNEVVVLEKTQPYVRLVKEIEEDQKTHLNESSI